jgi:hypothetical protein
VPVKAAVGGMYTFASAWRVAVSVKRAAGGTYTLAVGAPTPREASVYASMAVRWRPECWSAGAATAAGTASARAVTADARLRRARLGEGFMVASCWRA